MSYFKITDGVLQKGTFWRKDGDFLFNMNELWAVTYREQQQGNAVAAKPYYILTIRFCVYWTVAASINQFDTEHE